MRETAQAIADKAVSERHNKGMYRYVIEFTEPLIESALLAIEAETTTVLDQVEKDAEHHGCSRCWSDDHGQPCT